MRSLTEYRKTLEPLRGGTVPVDFVLDEILNDAEETIGLAHGEVSIRQAMVRSGRSYSYFERRLAAWAREGLARKVGGIWLLREAVVPPSSGDRGRSFDPAEDPEDIARRLVTEDAA